MKKLLFVLPLFLVGCSPMCQYKYLYETCKVVDTYTDTKGGYNMMGKNYNNTKTIRYAIVDCSGKRITQKNTMNVVGDSIEVNVGREKISTGDCSF